MHRSPKLFFLSDHLSSPNTQTTHTARSAFCQFSLFRGKYLKKSSSKTVYRSIFYIHTTSQTNFNVSTLDNKNTGFVQLSIFISLLTYQWDLSGLYTVFIRATISILHHLSSTPWQPLFLLSGWRSIIHGPSYSFTINLDICG